MQKQFLKFLVPKIVHSTIFNCKITYSIFTPLVKYKRQIFRCHPFLYFIKFSTSVDDGIRDKSEILFRKLVHSFYFSRNSLKPYRFPLKKEVCYV